MHLPRIGEGASHQWRRSADRTGASRLQSRPVPLRGVRLLVITPSVALETIVVEQMKSLPRALRAMLRLAGGNRPSAASMLFHLLFEPRFKRACMELGRRDALAKRGEIAAFLAA